jgi:hypothetical protein
MAPHVCGRDINMMRYNGGAPTAVVGMVTVSKSEKAPHGGAPTAVVGTVTVSRSEKAPHECGRNTNLMRCLGSAPTSVVGTVTASKAGNRLAPHECGRNINGMCYDVSTPTAVVGMVAPHECVRDVYLCYDGSTPTAAAGMVTASKVETEESAPREDSNAVTFESVRNINEESAPREDSNAVTLESVRNINEARCQLFGTGLLRAVRGSSHKTRIVVRSTNDRPRTKAR